MANEVTNTVLSWFLSILGTIITTVLLPYFISWLKTKTTNEKMHYVIDELSQTVTTSVAYVNQTFVDQLKADGKFDEEHQKEALKLAIDDVFNSLSTKTVSILQSDELDVVGIVTKYIEAEIKRNKSKS